MAIACTAVYLAHSSGQTASLTVSGGFLPVLLLQHLLPKAPEHRQEGKKGGGAGK